MDSILSEARSCFYLSGARGEEVGVSQAGMWGLEEKLFAGVGEQGKTSNIHSVLPIARWNCFSW